ncbi:PTK1 Serine/threonine-protein kinase PTK1/STK1 [Candida maltosa Xu316]
MPNIKSIFRKDPTPEPHKSPSTTGLSKLFHRHEKDHQLNQPPHPQSHQHATTTPTPSPQQTPPQQSPQQPQQQNGDTSEPPSKSLPKSKSPIIAPVNQTPHMNRTPSISSLKRRNTNPIQSSNGNTNNNSATNLHHSNSLSTRNRSNSDKIPHNPPRKVLTKAETFAHLNQLDTRNAAKQQLRNNRVSSNHAQSPLLSGDKIVYNPYGLNKTATQERPKNTSFYMSGVGDGERVLANPVASPNDYLPLELRQEHVNLLDDFEIDAGTRKLGDGGSSDVRIINACHRKKDLFALKKFTLLTKETDEEFYKRVSKEYVIHQRVAMSRHIVDAIAIVRIQSQSNLTRGWGMVMEFCGAGDLFSLIVKPGWKNSPINEKYCLFKQIAYGVKYLHDHDIVHRDLKPENVLLDANGLAKLCDFGVSEFGHENPDDLTSPIKMSTSYVGSPPYSPPEVMLLKEKSSTEIKSFAYDPFKMDCWGLGMMLFCLIYGGVPFQQSTPNDHAFRDYKFSHKRFCTDHHNFKDNRGFPKGPGSEFKLASKFESTGASRVAWKLCDPSPATRYTIDRLFEDPWFQGLEMCVYENPDQTVDPFVLPGTGNNINTHSASGYSSAANSQAPSRRGTFSSRPVASSHGYESHDENGNLQSSFKSMLDLQDVGEKLKKSSGGGPPAAELSSSNASIHSNDSSSSKLKLNSTPMSPSSQHPSLDRVNQAASPANGNLPAVEESDIEHEHETLDEKLDHFEKLPEPALDIKCAPLTEITATPEENGYEEEEIEDEDDEDDTTSENINQQQQQPQQQVQQKDGVRESSPSSLTHEHVLDSGESNVSSQQQQPNNGNTTTNDSSFAKNDDSFCVSIEYKPVLKSGVDIIHWNADGTCELGYKIKKHHHTEVSNVSNSSRR